MDSKPPRILLFGSGALGTVYAYLFQKASCPVTAVCRSNYAAASTQGFHIDSKLYGQGIHFKPTHVVRTPSEAVNPSEGPFDYVIVCSKALPDVLTSEAIEPAVTKGHTAIVLIQNGIGIEDEYAERFPSNPLLTCVAYIPTTQTSPGHITHGDVNILEVGPFPTNYPPATANASAERFISTLNSAGGNAIYHERDIQEKRWFKLIVNAPWNPICALTLSRDIAFLQSSDVAESVIMGVLEEVVQLCQAQGLKTITMEAAKGSFDKIIRPRLGTEGIEPSMLGDVLWGRRMEVEVILGNPVRVARKLGVQVPRMEMLYALTKGLDEANRWKQEGKSLTGIEVTQKGGGSS